MQRRVVPELLDDDLGTATEVADSLRDLRHINQWFGGTRTTISLLRCVAERSGERQLSLLEVGAGSGDVPLSAAKTLRQSGIDVRVTLLDRRWTHLPVNGQFAIAADAMQLPFGDDTFDVVSSSLFAHHFDPDALRALCIESLRVCRRAVIINDLTRSRLHLWLVYLGLPLFRSRITWHDAPASVRAAYTTKEMEAMLSDLNASGVGLSRHFLYRMGIIIWK